SALLQVFRAVGAVASDLARSEDLRVFFDAIQSLNEQVLLLAFHDRSDGGLFTTLCEMAFAGHTGIDVSLDYLSQGDTQYVHELFNEELGAVIQVRRADAEKVLQVLENHGLKEHSLVIGTLNSDDQIRFRHGDQTLLEQSRVYYQRI